MNILVTGGAGYIGAHLIYELEQAGHEVWGIDDLSNSHLSSLPKTQIRVGDFAEEQSVRKLIRTNDITAVFHLAAKISVAESYLRPEVYELTNYKKTQKLVEICGEEGIEHFVFSSTAAVYADGEIPYSEKTKIRPKSPYAKSKAQAEKFIGLKASEYGMNYLIFRSFNIAGAHKNASLGQNSPNSTHLIKLACEAALNKRNYLPLYGENHPTPDGTCVRDYLHIEDLVQAYLLGLDYLASSGRSEIFNCGSGKGLSVKQVIDFFHNDLRRPFEVVKKPARRGDIPQLVASNQKVIEILGWRPIQSDLHSITNSALQWEAQL